MDTINMTPDNIMRQGQETTNSHMRAAIEKINNSFGAGYAEKNPDLVSTFMLCSVIDSSTAFIIATIQESNSYY